ncbi:hypothetical protein NL337_26960, partial [Klebsiella pneumoniae]|nr:hypothetical protein [Klebsiella pneumoniae]
FFSFLFPFPLSSSIWRDIAILTNDASRCAAYQAESQNVKAKHYCLVPDALREYHIKKGTEGWIPITQNACEALKWFDE